MAEQKKEAAPRMLDEELVRRIADLLRETGLNELEIESKNMRIRASLGGSTLTQVSIPHNLPTPANTPASVSVQAGPAAEAHPGTVKSPMVGTAYVSPEPSAPAFVQVGDTVNMGQTLLIIEAMKVMNPIPAPKSGVVKKIIVSNAQPVEFGDPLLIIE